MKLVVVWTFVWTVSAWNVDSRCGQYSPEIIFKELDYEVTHARMGGYIAILLPVPSDHKYSKLNYAITKPNGEIYNYDKLETTSYIVHRDNKENKINSELKVTKANEVNKTVMNKFNDIDFRENIYEIKQIYTKSLYFLWETFCKMIDDMNTKEMTPKLGIDKKGIVIDIRKRIIDDERKEVIIGPLVEEHFGNFVVSTCYLNASGKEVEIYKTHGIYIEEPVNTIPRISTSLRPGEDLRIRLEKCIPNLQSCQLVAPPSTIDRAYTRDTRNPQCCPYIVENVEETDSGIWKIVAVADIVYVGSVHVNITYNVH